jgi:hypothetical protein
MPLVFVKFADAPFQKLKATGPVMYVIAAIITMSFETQSNKRQPSIDFAESINAFPRAPAVPAARAWRPAVGQQAPIDDCY